MYIVTTSLLWDIHHMILMELKHYFEIGWYNMYMIPIITFMSHEWRIYHIYNNLILELLFKSYMVINSFILYIYDIPPVLHSFICIIIYLLLLYPYNMLNGYAAINIFRGNIYSRESTFLSVKLFIGAQNKGHTFFLPIFMVGNIFTQAILFFHM